MAAIVRDYYFAEREFSDPFTNESHKVTLINRNTRSGLDLVDLAAADNADALIGALERAFGRAFADTDFSKDLVVRSFAAMAPPPEEPLVIFHL